MNEYVRAEKLSVLIVRLDSIWILLGDVGGIDNRSLQQGCWALQVTYATQKQASIITDMRAGISVVTSTLQNHHYWLYIERRERAENRLELVFNYNGAQPYDEALTASLA